MAARKQPNVTGALSAALVVAAALSGCSRTDIKPGFAAAAPKMRAESFTCCFEPEKFYPAPFIRLAIGLSDQLGPAVSSAAYGPYETQIYPGRLTGNTAAEAAIMQGLRPMDILLVSNHSYPLGKLVPGRFSHGLLYLGTEAELRAAGLWSLPALRPYQADIRAGQVLVETAAPATRLRSPAKGFEADRVLALRPDLTPAERRAAQREVIENLGVPINYSMAVVSPDGHYSCTGLLDHVMPELRFQHREVYGETVVMPDDIAAQAIRGERMHVLRYVVGDTDGGFARRSTFGLMADIAAFWGVPPG